MAYRLIDTSIHTDPEMMDLDNDAFHLLMYFFTCPHTAPSGIAIIHPRTLEFESRINNALEVVKRLGKYVMPLSEHRYLILNFVKHQAKGGNFIKSAIKSLLDHPDIIPIWWDRNKEIVIERLSKEGVIGKNEQEFIDILEQKSHEIKEIKPSLNHTDTIFKPSLVHAPTVTVTDTVTVTKTNTLAPNDSKPNRSVQEIKPTKLKSSKEDKDLAESFIPLVLEVSPHAKPNIEKWADTIRKMRQLDNIPHKEIRRVFLWANQDNFWRSNCLSMDTLREKFAQLDAKSRASPTLMKPNSAEAQTKQLLTMLGG